MAFLQCFLRDERGVTAIEYSLIAGLVSILIVGGARAIGLQLVPKFQSVANGLR